MTDAEFRRRAHAVIASVEFVGEYAPTCPACSASSPGSAAAYQRERGEPCRNAQHGWQGTPCELRALLDAGAASAEPEAPSPLADLTPDEVQRIVLPAWNRSSTGRSIFGTVQDVVNAVLRSRRHPPLG